MNDGRSTSKPDISLRRDSFQVEIRKKERNNMINEKRNRTMHIQNAVEEEGVYNKVTYIV